eukprot:scaffold2857_cov121-Isochrysis_galbana.AAC.10
MASAGTDPAGKYSGTDCNTESLSRASGISSDKLFSGSSATVSTLIPDGVRVRWTCASSRPKGVSFTCMEFQRPPRQDALLRFRRSLGPGARRALGVVVFVQRPLVNHGRLGAVSRSRLCDGFVCYYLLEM